MEGKNANFSCKKCCISWGSIKRLLLGICPNTPFIRSNGKKPIALYRSIVTKNVLKVAMHMHVGSYAGFTIQQLHFFAIL